MHFLVIRLCPKKLTFDGLVKNLLDLLHGVGIGFFSENEFSLDFLEVLLQQLPPLPEGLPHQALAVQVEQVEGKDV